jgi:hypothetical protein
MPAPCFFCRAIAFLAIPLDIQTPCLTLACVLIVNCEDLVQEGRKVLFGAPAVDSSERLLAELRI